MIQQKIICDRCNKVITDSEAEKNTKDSIIDALFGAGTGEPGYVEVNVMRADGICGKKMHFCGDCYDVAVKAWNS